jgi:hypothetical protein
VSGNCDVTALNPLPHAFSANAADSTLTVHLDERVGYVDRSSLLSEDAPLADQGL